MVELPHAEPDGLDCPEIGSWAESKYRLLSLYQTLFSRGMKNKWHQRVYLDLYCGPGMGRIRNSQRVLLGSPLLALSVPDRFDKYIFCDSAANLDALRARVERLTPTANVAYVSGDCNAQVESILREIPRATPTNKVLTLAFVDPYDLGIKFATLEKLASRFMDFLCLLALYMDANRNYANYIQEKSRKVDEFLGTDRWRVEWENAQMRGVSFPKFLAAKFASQMETLRYLPVPPYKMKEVRSDEKNLPLYHLALFSRSETAYQYWDEVLKYSDDQLAMFD